MDKDLQWVTVDKIFAAECVENGLRAHVGSGPMGGDGFVGLETMDGHLKWVAFFEMSNPFKAVSFQDQCVLAVSTHDVLWTFPIDDPCRFERRSLTEQERSIYPPNSL